MTDSNASDESPQMVHLVFGNGKCPEDPTVLIGVFADDDMAESVAKNSENNDWYEKTHVQDEEVIR